MYLLKFKCFLKQLEHTLIKIICTGNFYFENCETTKTHDRDKQKRQGINQSYQFTVDTLMQK
jgi:hypothetical protein